MAGTKMMNPISLVLLAATACAAAQAQPAATPAEEVATIQAQAAGLEQFAAAERISCGKADQLRLQAEILAVRVATASGQPAVAADARSRMDYLFRLARPDVTTAAMLEPTLAEQAGIKQNLELTDRRLAELAADREAPGRAAESLAESFRVLARYYRRNAEVADKTALVLRSRANRYQLLDDRHNAIESVAQVTATVPDPVAQASRDLPDLSGLPAGDPSQKKLDKAVERLLNPRRHK